MKRTIRIFSFIALFLGLTASFSTLYAQSGQSQSNTHPSSQEAIVALQQKAELAITRIDWITKLQNIDARTLENLEKWHQFPFGKMLKQNAAISRQDLTTAVQAWYNENPTNRAKIILGFE